jgi:hypothetical protein
LARLQKEISDLRKKDAAQAENEIDANTKGTQFVVLGSIGVMNAYRSAAALLPSSPEFPVRAIEWHRQGVSLGLETPLP